MGTRGYWNVRRKGKWFQFHQTRERISSPGDAFTYLTLKNFQDGVMKSNEGSPVPFPIPLQQRFNYVYTLDLDSEHLTVSFWHCEEGHEKSTVFLSMRRLSLTSIEKASDLSIEALLRNGSDPLLDLPGCQESPRPRSNYKLWNIEISQPSAMTELQYRMFTDFVYQWRFYIDDRTLWQCTSSALFRRLCIALLRLASWDFEVSTEFELATLPLGAKCYPGWDASPTEIYWFHRYLVVLCQDLGTSLAISAAISRAREFVGDLGGKGKEIKLILISFCDVAFIQISANEVLCSTVFQLLTNSSATECSAGFRVLTYILTSQFHGGRTEAEKIQARQISSINLPTEVLGVVLNSTRPYDIVSFAQASVMVENWYYSSLPQLSELAIHRLDVSISCCGRRDNSIDGVCCSECHAWRHFECLDPSERTSKDCYICFTCCLSRQQVGPRQKLIPGAIGRANRRGERADGCRVMHGTQEKFMQLRVTSPAVMRPELRLIDRYLTRTPPNQIDYILLFNGSWSGLAYGLDNVGSAKRYIGRQEAAGLLSLS